MDFWSRLIGGVGSSPTRPIKASTPAERLATCKRICAAIEQIWRSPTSQSPSHGVITSVATCLKRLNTVLDDESQTQATFSCQLYVASSKVYVEVVKLALSLRDGGILGASTRLFHILINGEVDEVLKSNFFARCLTDFVRQTAGVKVIDLNEEEQSNQVELLFGVATKIRLDPEILPAWFYPERDQPPDETATGFDPFAGATRKHEFPLFYLLVAYVYHDGPMGVFARTGLLYLIETASKSEKLEKWMVESDLATLMGSGLGALYSRLSRVPPSLVDSNNLPSILTSSDRSQLLSDNDDVIPDFNHNVHAFISFLMFWQDTLDHCASAEVADTLLDHFQVLFLQQVLYPSLLESSDLNEDSTASIIIHLCRILDSLDHPALLQRVLQYLLASSPMSSSTEPSARKPRMSFSRRQTLDRLATLAKVANNPSPILFNLTDVIVLSLQSSHATTVAATLKMVSIILRKQHSYAVSSFSKPSMVSVIRQRNITALNEDMEHLFKLAGAIADNEAINDTYDSLLKDVLYLLESHDCRSEDLSLHHEKPAHLYSPKDSLLELLFGHLKSFFANDTKVNLLLTESIVCLASCSITSLDSWLFPVLDEKASDQSSPTILAILESLGGQVKEVQSQVPDWNTKIKFQRARLTEETTTDALKPMSSSGQPQQRTSSNGPSSQSPRLDPHTSDLTTHAQGPPVKSSKQQSETPRRSLGTEPLGSAERPLSISPTRLEIQQHVSRSRSPLSKTASRSPTPPDQRRTRVIINFDAQTAKMSFHVVVEESSTQATSNESNPDGVNSTESQPSKGKGKMEVSLSHLLTNAIILQEFVLEIAAVMQIRASMFDEVDVS